MNRRSNLKRTSGLSRSSGTKRKPGRGNPDSLKPKRCAVCQVEFKPKTGFQRYCGAECRVEGEMVDRTCARCEKVFRRPRSSPVRFCSNRCANQVTAERRKGQKGKFGWGVSQAKPPRKVLCPICKTTFETSAKTQKYCSTSCRSHGTKDARRKTLGTLPVWSIKTKQEEACRNCGRFAEHLHHIVPRSKSRKGSRDMRNGMPLCFECHRGWHDRVVRIPLDRLKPDELRFAAELVGAVWIERNYPPPTVAEQADLTRERGLRGACLRLVEELGTPFALATEEQRAPGDTVRAYLELLDNPACARRRVAEMDDLLRRISGRNYDREAA